MVDKEKNTALDKIIVKRPTLPSELLQTAPSIVNPEFQQKPLAEFDENSSEDLHGGSELTFSMPTWHAVTHSQSRQKESTEEDEEEASGGQQMYNKTETYNVVAEMFYKSLRHLQTEFYRIVEMIAEEKSKHFDPSLGGIAEYNVKKLFMRRYEGKPLTSYKTYRVRESVMLILDNSGSMAAWADMLSALAALAAKRRDIEVFLAPNGKVEKQISPIERSVKHNEFMDKTLRRTIIYVGDFDGGDTPVVLSWQNTVYWVAPEERYRRFKEHDWMHYEENKFKGYFIRVFTIEDMLDAFKKAVSGLRWIDTCSECGKDNDDDYE